MPSAGVLSEWFLAISRNGSDALTVLNVNDERCGQLFALALQQSDTPSPMKGLRMRIFRQDLTRSPRAPGTLRDDDLRVPVELWVPCDRCRVAEAQVQVLTGAGPVFLCQHHYRQHHDAIAAAGHLTRVWRPGLGPRS
jgi:hypothetical protein